MHIYRNSLFAVILILSVISGTSFGQQKINVLKINSTKDLHAFFQNTPYCGPIISGHRGGMEKGFPENSIATFENTLKYTPAFFEIDPRMTKDSVIVLLHDDTLDRTTSGKGKLADFTYEEIKKLYLRDPDGNISKYHIPTLDEAIEWARGKTIMNLDHKDVPLATTAKIVEKHNASHFVMLTVHSPEEALFYLSKDKNLMFSVAIKTVESFEKYEAAKVPWKQVIAYIGPTVKPENKVLYKLLNEKGVMCMISSASSYDKLKEVEKRAAAYRDIIQDGATILETDYPIDAANAIRDLLKNRKGKEKFYGTIVTN